MTKHSALAQIKQIDAIFGGRRNSEVKVIETQRSTKCNVHGQPRRGSSGSVHSGGKRDSVGSVNGRPVSLNTILGGASSHQQLNVEKVDKKESYNAKLNSLPTQVRNSIANLDNRNYFQDFKPVNVTTNATNRDSFSNGIRRTSMPVLNQQRYNVQEMSERDIGNEKNPPVQINPPNKLIMLKNVSNNQSLL